MTDPSNPLSASAEPSPLITRRRVLSLGVAAAALSIAASVAPALAFDEPPPGRFRPAEIVDNGHKFFGSMSRGLALTVEEATRRWGEPNGYILGQEASGAIVGGVRYGEGTLYTRNAGQRRIYWQGPSIGFDVGGDGRPHDDAPLQHALGLRPLPALCRGRRLGLFHRRVRDDRRHE